MILCHLGTVPRSNDPEKLFGLSRHQPNGIATLPSGLRSPSFSFQGPAKPQQKQRVRCNASNPCLVSSLTAVIQEACSVPALRPGPW